MKVFRQAVLAATLLLAATTTATAANKSETKPIYIFGFSASFNDSTVYFTDIQHLDSAWIEHKTKFLLGRENFSYQLRDYLAESKSLPSRTCIVIYAFSKKDITKKMASIKKKYVGTNKQPYAINYIAPQEFSFKYVDMSPDEEVAEKPKAKKEKKKRPEGERPKGERPEGMSPGGMGHGSMPPRSGGQSM